MRPTARPAGSPRPGPGTLNLLAFALFAVASGTNVPTPLLLVYQDTLELSASDVTALFGSYALGLLPALLLAGALSDRWGRRRTVVPFVVLSGLVSLLFALAADSLALLYLARFLQGAVSGVVFTVASAWLQEVAGAGHGRVAATRATVAMSAGFALGPLMSGLVAEYGRAPTTLPYLVHSAVVLPGLLAVLRVPETVVAMRPGRLLALGLPREARWPFWTVLVPTAVGVYAFPSVAITLLPILVANGGLSVAYVGVVAAVTLGCGTLVARPGQALGVRAAPIGAGLGSLGFALGTVAVAQQLSVLLLPAALLLGSGSGLCLTSGLALTARLAPSETRGAVNSAFYAFAYAGFGAPLLLAWMAEAYGDVVPLAVISATFAAVAGWLALDRDRTGAAATPVPPSP